MTDIIEFQLEDGTPIFVEAPETPDQGMKRTGRGDKDLGRADKKFNEIVARIKPAAEAVLNTFREMDTPEEIGLEFGLKFNAKAGAVFASVDSQATFKVALKWTRKSG